MNHSIQLSPELYQILQQRAAALNATIESVVESAIRLQGEPKSSTVPNQTENNQSANVVNPALETDSLSAELADELTQLAFLTDAELWYAARTQLSPDDHARMEALLRKQQINRLEATELAEAEALAGRYDRTMLIRAKAAVLLKERGHDIFSQMS